MMKSKLLGHLVVATDCGGVELEKFNGFKILSLPEIRIFEELFCINYLGVVYAIEYGDKIKIGCSKKPYSRICSLKKWAEGYGGIKVGEFCVSQPHTNYREMESFFHKLFSKERAGRTELFSIGLKKFFSEASAYTHLFKNESSELMEHELYVFDTIKSCLYPGFEFDAERMEKIIWENPWMFLDMYKHKIIEYGKCVEHLEKLCEIKKSEVQREEEIKRKEKFADDVIHSVNTISMHSLAIIISQNGLNTSKDSLFNWMIENGFVDKKEDGKFLLTEKSIKLDLLRIEPEEGLPCVTGRGQFYFVMLLLWNQEVDLSDC